MSLKSGQPLSRDCTLTDRRTWQSYWADYLSGTLLKEKEKERVQTDNATSIFQTNLILLQFCSLAYKMEWILFFLRAAAQLVPALILSASAINPNKALARSYFHDAKRRHIDSALTRSSDT
jgi:hypothetical protein